MPYRAMQLSDKPMVKTVSVAEEMRFKTETATCRQDIDSHVKSTMSKISEAAEDGLVSIRIDLYIHGVENRRTVYPRVAKELRLMGFRVSYGGLGYFSSQYIKINWNRPWWHRLWPW